MTQDEARPLGRPPTQEGVLDGSKEAKFDPQGGYGYDLNLAPHPDCPECDGHGIPRVVFKDTCASRGTRRLIGRPDPAIMT